MIWRVAPPFLGECFQEGQQAFNALFALPDPVVTESLISRVMRVERCGRIFYVKVYWPCLRRKPSHYFGQSRIRREWENLLFFRELGIPSPEPVAWGLERRWGRFHRAAIITGAIHDTRDLETLALTGDPRLGQKEWIREVGRQVAWAARRLHGAGFIHMDFKWRNILVSETDPPRVYFIDCPAGRKLPGFLLGRGRIKDLACLDKVARNHMRRVDRLRFLLDYLGKEKLTPTDKKMAHRILVFFQGRE